MTHSRQAVLPFCRGHVESAVLLCKSLKSWETHHVDRDRSCFSCVSSSSSNNNNNDDFERARLCTNFYASTNPFLRLGLRALIVVSSDMQEIIRYWHEGLEAKPFNRL